jgi:hypothetical protein
MGLCVLAALLGACTGDDNGRRGGRNNDGNGDTIEGLDGVWGEGAATGGEGSAGVDWLDEDGAASDEETCAAACTALAACELEDAADAEACLAECLSDATQAQAECVGSTECAALTDTCGVEEGTSTGPVEPDPEDCVTAYRRRAGRLRASLYRRRQHQRSGLRAGDRLRRSAPGVFWALR